MKLHYQTVCVETLYLRNKQDHSTIALLTRMLQFYWVQLFLSFLTRFIDESFVSYHLVVWYIPLNKAHAVTSFFLQCSNSRPPL